MKQFKLTDVEGKEFILHVNEAKVGNIVTAKDISIEPVEPPAPEIKVGMWVKDPDGDIFRVGRIHDGGSIDGDKNDIKHHRNWDAEDLVICSPAEIEAHLKDVCQKYVGKKARCLWNSADDGICSDMFTYYEHDDHLLNHSNNGRIVLYHKGQFAEIIPDKKPLPKTREEFKQMHEEYLDYFLDQYQF